MPELPEVETIRRDLEHLRGRTITRVCIASNADRIIRGVSPDAFARRISRRRIDDIARRGKYLLFHLSNRDDDPLVYLAVHLRMTGSLTHCRPDDDCGPYTRAVLSLDDGTELRYSDLRKFGQLWVVDRPEDAVGALGPEPLSDDFTADRLRESLMKRRTSVKAVLLD